MPQPVKTPAAKPEDPSLISRTHLVEGENKIAKSCPMTSTIVLCEPPYAYTHAQKNE